MKNAVRVPFKEKVKFVDKVRRLSREGLGKFVGLVQELCPKAKLDADPTKIYIKVDSIDQVAFAKLTAMLDANLAPSHEFPEPATKRAKTK